MELYFSEYVKEGRDRILRIYIDKEGGVTSDDCAFVSSYLAGELDRDDPIEEPYLLEVSSPGIERELRYDRHYLASIGKTVKVSLFTAFEGAKTYEGELVSFGEDSIRLMVSGRGQTDIPKEKISKVRIVFKYN